MMDWTADQQRAAAWLGVIALMGVAAAAVGVARGAAPTRSDGAVWDARLEAARRIDINAAGVAELERLPDIGPRLAQRIVEERTVRGRFRRPEELARVSGIGPKKLERLRDYVTVE